MNKTQAIEQIKRFTEGETLTFLTQRFGESGEEWIVRCNEIPAISTSGFGFDERVIRDQVKDAVITAAGIEGELGNDLLNEKEDVWKALKIL